MGSTDATDGEKGAVVNEYQAETDEEQQETKPARGLSRNFGPVALDVAIAMAAGYFVIFAALANSWDGTPVSDYKAKALLEAAKIVRLHMIFMLAVLSAMTGPHHLANSVRHDRCTTRYGCCSLEA